MEVKELGHIVLYVRELQRSRDFYGKVLGWKEVVNRRGMAMYSSGRTHHELLLIEVGPQAQPLPQGRRVGLYHFGLRVGNTDKELVEALAQVEAAGVKVVGLSDHTVTHSLYIEDPDGNEIELYIDVPGVDWKADPKLVAAPTKALAL